MEMAMVNDQEEQLIIARYVYRNPFYFIVYTKHEALIYLPNCDLNKNASLQLSPGRECSDTDMDPQGTQSQDCEPTPPLQRHNSNFYLPPIEGESPRHVRMYHARHSPHARQRSLFC